MEDLIRPSQNEAVSPALSISGAYPYPPSTPSNLTRTTSSFGNGSRHHATPSPGTSIHESLPSSPIPASYLGWSQKVLRAERQRVLEDDQLCTNEEEEEAILVSTTKKTTSEISMDLSQLRIGESSSSSQAVSSPKAKKSRDRPILAASPRSLNTSLPPPSSSAIPLDRVVQPTAIPWKYTPSHKTVEIMKRLNARPRMILDGENQDPFFNPGKYDVLKRAREASKSPSKDRKVVDLVPRKQVGDSTGNPIPVSGQYWKS